MPFLRAGFNERHRDTGIRGWTRHVEGKRFEPAALIQFAGGDYAWHGERFLAWGEQCVLGSWPFELPDEWQYGLEQSTLPRPERRPRPVKIVLPYPVSANRYWRTFAYFDKITRKPRSVTAPSDEAKAFKEECGWRAKEAGVHVPFSTAVELRIRLIPENRVCMDLDNALKVSIDALKGVVYEDDSQVYRITAERAEPEPGKRLEVEVLPFVIPMALEAAA